MKTSFAPFQQEIPFKNGNRRGTNTRTVFINCEDVTAVANSIDDNGNIIPGHCTLFFQCGDAFEILGEAEQVIATVRSYCKDRTP